MTVGWYARSKKIPLEHVRVELWHWIHAKHCADCETKVGRIDCIELALHFTGNITDEQRTKLPQIANRCPMHQTLKSEINIQTRVASSYSHLGRVAARSQVLQLGPVSVLSAV
jgi:putative redox protein